jgi:hypothetical protein
MASTAIVIMEMKLLPNRTKVRRNLLLDDFDHFAALVKAAGRAGAMRQFLLVALRALGNTGADQPIVGSAIGRAALGVAALGIRHRKSFLRNLPGSSTPLRRQILQNRMTINDFSF